MLQKAQNDIKTDCGNLHSLKHTFRMDIRLIIGGQANVKREARETKPNQTKPNQTKPNQTKPNQTKPNQTKPNQTNMNAHSAISDEQVAQALGGARVRRTRLGGTRQRRVPLEARRTERMAVTRIRVVHNFEW